MNAWVNPEMVPLAELFYAAATMLTGAAGSEGPARDLLARLDYLDNDTEQAAHRAAMLRAAAGFKRVFTLREDNAPGLIALGAEADPGCVGMSGMPLMSVSGTGLTFRQAFESCVGEGVERLSQYAGDGDFVEQRSADAALAGASPALRDLWDRLRPYRRNPGTALTAWTSAAGLDDGQVVQLPADICFRRPSEQRDIDPPWPLSTGCAAGPDHLSAMLSGLLELIERDAVALWWRGGRRARLVPGDVGSAVLGRLRGGNTGRRTWFLDVTNDSGVPAVVAASCDDDGFGLCIGSAARTTLAGAAAAAVREMAQMELAHRLAAAKRSAQGDGALHDTDRQHLRRFAMIDVTRTRALQPLAPPLPPADLNAPTPLAALAQVRQLLAAAGLSPCAIDLTRSVFGIPVVRAVCPGLEQGMTAPPGPRLRAAAERSGADPMNAIPL